MADAKISALPASTTPLAGTEVLPIVQSSTTKKVSVENLTAGRAVSMASVVTTGKGNFGNGPNAVIARADVGVHFANRTSTATTANLFVATSNEQGADIGGSIAMGGYVDATSNIPLATWSGRKFNGSSGNYAGYALLTVSNSGGGAVDTTKILSDGSIRLLVAGSGIDFSADPAAAGMTSQLLDDYEEGTFTATLAGSTANPTTPVTATSRYTKTGRQVSCQINFVSVDTTGALGPILVQGLPFAAGFETIGAAAQSAMSSTNIPAALLGAGATQMEIIASNARINLPFTAGAGQFLQINITYTV
jgi:hypothetical protein